jgi:hypothetical protein
VSLYYIKQDNTIWGCGEPECCGEYEERIEWSFAYCDCGIPESEMTGSHLQGCYGGGEVLDWRIAKAKEWEAFTAGKDEGYSEGWSAGIEWQKERGENT